MYSLLFIQDATLAVIVAVSLLPMVLLGIEMVHAAFTTEYRITDGEVELRSGWIMHRRFPASDIVKVDRVGFISRVLGWAPGVYGYCNRFKNGLVLYSDKRAFFVSPTDLDAFSAALDACGPPRDAEAKPPELGRASKRFMAAIFVLNGLLVAALAVPMILGIVPPNQAYGLRTERTLSSPEVWYPANRIGGIYMLVSAMAIVAGSLLLLRYGRRLRPNVFVLVEVAMTILCLLGSVALTLWHVG